MFDIAIDAALHHRGAIVVLDIPLPPGFVHEPLSTSNVLLETLFTEVLNRVIVCIRQEVVDVPLDCMVLESIHEASSVALNLLCRRDGKENYLSELLIWERSKNTPTQNDRLLTLDFLHDYHGLVHSVHHESDNVWARHARQLFSNDVLQVDEIPH